MEGCSWWSESESTKQSWKYSPSIDPRGGCGFRVLTLACPNKHAQCQTEMGKRRGRQLQTLKIPQPLLVLGCKSVGALIRSPSQNPVPTSNIPHRSDPSVESTLRPHLSLTLRSSQATFQTADLMTRFVSDDNGNILLVQSGIVTAHSHS